MAQNIAGWTCVIVGLALVVVHVLKTFAPPPATQSQGSNEGVAAVVEKLAGSSPNLAGGITFVVLGLVVLGLLDVSVAAGTTGTTPAGQ